MRSGDGGDRVIARPGRVHDLHPIPIRLFGSRPGGALEHDDHRWIQASPAHRCPDSCREGSRRAGAIAPPAGGPRPDHVGSVDDEHLNTFARSPNPSGSYLLDSHGRHRERGRGTRRWVDVTASGVSDAGPHAVRSGLTRHGPLRCVALRARGASNRLSTDGGGYRDQGIDDRCVSGSSTSRDRAAVDAPPVRGRPATGAVRTPHQ
jgi:hypothetical protein